MALRKIGVIWSKKSKKGSEYMRINLNLKGIELKSDVYLMAFKNNKKKSNKQPDWNIYIDIEEQVENVSEDDL